MFYEHCCGRIQVIPILIDPYDLSITAFHKIERLGSNILPIRDLDTFKYHNNLSLIAMDLYCSITKKAAAQREIDDEWARVLQENSVDEYLEFYKAYRLSKYGEKALLAYKELLDEQLWKQAVEKDEVEYYLKYLKQSPLQLHKNKAIAKIAGIESKEVVYRQDIQDSLNPGILLEYKSRFTENGKMSEVNQQLRTSFRRPFDQYIEEKGKIKTKANYLNYQIHQSCTPEEVFTYDLLEKVKRNIDLKMEVLLAQTHDIKDQLVRNTFYGYGSCILLLLMIMGLNIQINTASFKYHLIVILVIASFLILRAFLRIKKDVTWYQQRCIELNKKFTQLKIAFLKYDTVIQGQITKLLNHAEDWVVENQRKSIQYYLFHKWIKKSDRNPKWDY